jgi:hypothetical protein
MILLLHTHNTVVLFVDDSTLHLFITINGNRLGVCIQTWGKDYDFINYFYAILLLHTHNTVVLFLDDSTHLNIMTFHNDYILGVCI